jgi:hypothetical protein
MIACGSSVIANACGMSDASNGCAEEWVHVGRDALSDIQESFSE